MSEGLIFAERCIGDTIDHSLAPSPWSRIRSRQRDHRRSLLAAPPNRASPKPKVRVTVDFSDRQYYLMIATHAAKHNRKLLGSLIFFVTIMNANEYLHSSLILHSCDNLGPQASVFIDTAAVLDCKPEPKPHRRMVIIGDKEVPVARHGHYQRPSSTEEKNKNLLPPASRGMTNNWPFLRL